MNLPNERRFFFKGIKRLASSLSNLNPTPENEVITNLSLIISINNLRLSLW